MREFQLSPLLIGCMFVVQGGCYGISAPLWGYTCDRKPPKMVSFIGSFLIAVGFLLIGPVPILHLKKSIGLIIGALVLHGT